MIEAVGGMLHSEAGQGVKIIQKVIKKTTIEMEVTIDNKGSHVNPDHQLKDQELHQCPSRVQTYFTCRQFGHFA